MRRDTAARAAVFSRLGQAPLRRNPKRRADRAVEGTSNRTSWTTLQPKPAMRGSWPVSPAPPRGWAWHCTTMTTLKPRKRRTKRCQTDMQRGFPASQHNPGPPRPTGAVHKTNPGANRGRGKTTTATRCSKPPRDAPQPQRTQGQGNRGNLPKPLPKPLRKTIAPTSCQSAQAASCTKLQPSQDWRRA